jgi:hypothetical protein
VQGAGLAWWHLACGGAGEAVLRRNGKCNCTLPLRLAGAAGAGAGAHLSSVYAIRQLVGYRISGGCSRPPAGAAASGERRAVDADDAARSGAQRAARSAQRAVCSSTSTTPVPVPGTAAFTSPNYTDLRPPSRYHPHRGACTRHQPRWAGGTNIWTIHGGHLERQNAQDGLAMTRRR